MGVGTMAILGLLAAFAGLVTGITGIGANYVMVPALTLFFDPKVTVAVASAFALALIVVLMPRATQAVSWTHVPGMAVAALVGLPIGLATLAAVSSEVMKMVVGIIVATIAFLAFQTPESRDARRAVTQTGSAMAGLISGALMGLAGLGGPPIILYLHGRVPVLAARATVLAALAPVAAMNVALLMASAEVNLSSMGVAALLTVPGIVGAQIGERKLVALGGQGLKKAVQRVVLFGAISIFTIGLVEFSFS